MPLYEITKGGELFPFRRLHADAGLYERDLESLLWDNLDELTGEPMFRVARQATVLGGGRPDIIALDHGGRVVVIEVKRNVDRGQLAQCLEYAGWARTTNLDEISTLYHTGPGEFFRDWQEFTGTSTPVIINSSPRLILVARDFHGRTGAALDFLIENGLPVDLVPISIYEDENGRRLVDVEAEHEPMVLPSAADARSPASPLTREGRRIRLVDLIDAGLLKPGDELIWERVRVGETYPAAVTENGSIQLDDGRTFSSPSRAAIEASGLGAYDGWWAWRVVRLGNRLLKDIRTELIESRACDES
jgi:hypothetical protein